MRGERLRLLSGSGVGQQGFMLRSVLTLGAASSLLVCVALLLPQSRQGGGREATILTEAAADASPTYDKTAAEAQCKALTAKTCTRELLNPTRGGVPAKLCSFNRRSQTCLLSLRYDSYFSITQPPEILSRYLAPSQRAGRGRTSNNPRIPSHFSRVNRTVVDGDEAAEDEADANDTNLETEEEQEDPKDAKDEKAVEAILGDLEPTYAADAPHHSPEEFDNEDPYGGLRQFDAKSQKFVHHDFNPAVYEHWARHLARRRRIEWCDWGTEMVPCAPGFGGAWYSVGHRWRDVGIWDEAHFDPNDKHLTKGHHRHNENGQGSHVYAGKRSSDYLWTG